MKNQKAIILVNAVTMTRVIGTFLMPIICFFISPCVLVIYIMCLLLTDALDGILARRLKASTIFGSLLDQIADKLFGIAILAVLGQKYSVMLLPILTETIIAIIAIRSALRGGLAESSILGKIKTLVLGIIILGGLCTVYAQDFIILFDNTTKFGNLLINFFMKIFDNQIYIIQSLAFVSVGSGLMVACDYWLRVKNELKIAKEAGIKPEEYQIKKGKALMNALFSEEYYQKNKKEPLIKKLGVRKNEKCLQK